MPPRLLFLDDRTKRIQAAWTKYADFEVTIVCNVRECLRYLSNFDWNIVSLDHDLNGCDFDDPDGTNTGMEVVRYLEKTGWPPSKKQPIFYVHSSNIFAAHLMVTRLQAIGLIAEWHRFEYPAKQFSNPAKSDAVTANNGT